MLLASLRLFSSAVVQCKLYNEELQKSKPVFSLSFCKHAKSVSKIFPKIEKLLDYHEIFYELLTGRCQTVTILRITVG